MRSINFTPYLFFFFTLCCLRGIPGIVTDYVELCPAPAGTMGDLADYADMLHTPLTPLRTSARSYRSSNRLENLDRSACTSTRPWWRRCRDKADRTTDSGPRAVSRRTPNPKPGPQIMLVNQVCTSPRSKGTLTAVEVEHRPVGFATCIGIRDRPSCACGVGVAPGHGHK